MQVELAGLGFTERVAKPGREGVQPGQVERAAENGQSGQRREREGDDGWILARALCRRAARLPEEDQPHLAGHVEGGQECGRGEGQVDARRVLEGVREDFIFREKARQRRQAGEGHRADEIHPAV